MPSVTRELSITYAGVTFGGSSERLLHNQLRVDKDYESVTVQFDFVIHADTEAAFKTEIALVEAALRTPRQRLLITQGSETIYDFDPSTDTGFNADPRIVKVGDEIFDTGRSRFYSISIDIELPADLAGQSGRRDSSVTLDFTDSRVRRLTVSGQYSAIGGTSARDKYNANISSYLTTLTTGFGGTWEIVSESAEADDTDKTLDFIIVLDEIIFSQSAIAFSDPAVVNPILSITRVDDFSTGGVTVGGVSTPFVTIQINYSTGIDKTVTTDLKGKYESDIRQFLIDSALSLFQTPGGTVISESVTLDSLENRITVVMQIITKTESDVIEGLKTLEVDVDTGINTVPVWREGGLSKFVFRGPQTMTRIITIRVSKSDIPAPPPPQIPAGKFAAGLFAKFIIPEPPKKEDVAFFDVALRDAGTGTPAGGGRVFFLRSANKSESRRKIGKAPNQIDVIDTTLVTVEEGIVPVTVPIPNIP